MPPIGDVASYNKLKLSKKKWRGQNKILTHQNQALILRTETRVLKKLIFEVARRKMLIRVQYNNDLYDYVTGRILNQHLARKNIKKFYRYSEKKWATIGVDRIRGISGGMYDGPERRGTLSAYAS